MPIFCAIVQFSSARSRKSRSKSFVQFGDGSRGGNFERFEPDRIAKGKPDDARSPQTHTDKDKTRDYIHTAATRDQKEAKLGVSVWTYRTRTSPGKNGRDS